MVTRTLVVIPAWNEAAAIGDTIAEIQQAQPELDLLVVSDGSMDATATIARSSGACVIELPYNLGVGGAMRAGYKFARRFDYDQAIQVDADGQHNPQDISAVLAGLETAHISIGARFAGVGDYEVRGPRSWAMRLLSTVVSRLAHTRLTDVTSGFRAADRTAIAQFCRYFPVEYLGDTIDSLVMAVRSGLTVTQAPVAMRPRRAGSPSNGPWMSAVYLFRSMFALLISMTRRPIRYVNNVTSQASSTSSEVD